MLYPNICYTIVISHHVISLLVYYNTPIVISIYIHLCPSKFWSSVDPTCHAFVEGLLADGGQSGDPPTPAGEPGTRRRFRTVLNVKRSKRYGGWKENHAHRYGMIW